MKGQNLRLFVNGKVVAAATSCTCHIAMTVEDASTKDTTGGAPQQEVTGYTYDISSDSLFTVDVDKDGNNTFDLLKVMMAGKAVPFTFESTSGEKNRAKGTGNVVSGSVVINDASFQAQNRQNATATFQAQGTGPLLLDGVDYSEAKPSGTGSD